MIEIMKINCIHAYLRKQTLLTFRYNQSNSGTTSKAFSVTLRCKYVILKFIAKAKYRREKLVIDLFRRISGSFKKSHRKVPTEILQENAKQILEKLLYANSQNSRIP